MIRNVSQILSRVIYKVLKGTQFNLSGTEEQKSDFERFAAGLNVVSVQSLKKRLPTISLNLSKPPAEMFEREGEFVSRIS